MANLYTNQTVLITGTSKGLGLELAQYFLKEGATVIGFSRSETNISHSSFKHYPVDVGNSAQVQEAFSDINKNFKKIDVLINNAAVMASQFSIMMPEKNAQAMMQTNVMGTFFVSREAAKIMMKTKKGRIINIGSMASALEPAGDSVYSATKSAVISLTNVMAKELGQLNITCNTLGVTAYETDMMNSIPKDKLDAIIHSLPMKRYATFKDITNVINFFAHVDSDYITAQTVFLGGVH